MRHGPRPQPEPDIEEEEDDPEADDQDFHEGDGAPYMDASHVRIKVADAEIDIVAPDAETATDLLKVALDAIPKLRGSESN